MCAQCMATAATAGATATGIRSWLAAKSPEWLSAARLRIVTIALIVLAVLASATLSSA
jgi:hypothetical protein